jgi:hypothetical protein
MPDVLAASRASSIHNEQRAITRSLPATATPAAWEPGCVSERLATAEVQPTCGHVDSVHIGWAWPAGPASTEPT